MQLRCNCVCFVSVVQIQRFFDPKRITNKMSSSLLNVSNGSSKPEEFSPNDTEVLVDNKEQNWFKRAHIGQYLGIVRIITSTTSYQKRI